MASSEREAAGEVVIIYDGRCPFCSRYTQLVRLRQEFGSVTLVDARSSSVWRQRIAREGLDINEGFVVYHNETMYHGAQALRFVEQARRSDTWRARLGARLLENRAVGQLLYELLKFGRRVSLAFLGIGKIV